MPEITEAELPANVRALWLKALSAVQTNNHGYAVKLLLPVLKDAPAFLDGRKVLRKCESIVTGGPKKAASVFGIKTGSNMKGAVKKDPAAAVNLIEAEL